MRWGRGRGRRAGGRRRRPRRRHAAMGVEIVTLEPKPVEQMTEFVGTIKSRQSTNIQPQVEGFITRIRVKSGDRVAAGATLMEIDSRVQQASLQGLESVRAQREIDVTYAQQEAERAAQAAQGRRRQPDGRRSRRQRAEGGRSAAADGRRTDPHVAHRSRLLPRHLADRRRRRRHSRARRRSRHEVDAADDGRCERGAGGVPERARAAGAEAEAGPDRPPRGRSRRAARRREDQLHLPVGRYADADRARENAGDGARQRCAPINTCARR